MKKELSWSWYGEGCRRRECSRKIKVVKVKIIFSCQNHAVVNVAVLAVKWKYVIFQDPGVVNVVARLILLLTSKIQWILSISTILYLEYLSISNKMFDPLKFPPTTLHSLSLFRISLSRTFPYIEQIFRSLEPFSLSITSTYIFEFYFRIPE